MRHRGVEHGGKILLLESFIVHYCLRDVHELNHFAIVFLKLDVEPINDKVLLGNILLAP